MFIMRLKPQSSMFRFTKIEFFLKDERRIKEIFP